MSTPGTSGGRGNFQGNPATQGTSAGRGNVPRHPAGRGNVPRHPAGRENVPRNPAFQGNRPPPGQGYGPHNPAFRKNPAVPSMSVSQDNVASQDNVQDMPVFQGNAQGVPRFQAKYLNTTLKTPNIRWLPSLRSNVSIIGYMDLKLLPQGYVVKRYIGNNARAAQAREEAILVKIKAICRGQPPFFVSIERGLNVIPDPHIVLERCCGGDLHDYRQFIFDKRNVKQFPESKIWDVYSQLLGALNFLRHGHSGWAARGGNLTWKRIIHRDIKPENVLVRLSGPGPFSTKPMEQYVLSDFDVALEVGAPEWEAERWKFRTTALWAAPEMLQRSPIAKGKFQLYELPSDGKVDIWGVGAVVHFLALGRPPVAHALDHAYKSPPMGSFDYATPRVPTFIDAWSTGTEAEAGTNPPNPIYSRQLNTRMLEALAFDPAKRTPIDTLGRTWSFDESRLPYRRWASIDQGSFQSFANRCDGTWWPVVRLPPVNERHEFHLPDGLISFACNPLRPAPSVETDLAGLPYDRGLSHCRKLTKGTAKEGETHKKHRRVRSFDGWIEHKDKYGWGLEKPEYPELLDKLKDVDEYYKAKRWEQRRAQVQATATVRTMIHVRQHEFNYGPVMVDPHDSTETPPVTMVPRALFNDSREVLRLCMQQASRTKRSLNDCYHEFLRTGIPPMDTPDEHQIQVHETMMPTVLRPYFSAFQLVSDFNTRPSVIPSALPPGEVLDDLPLGPISKDIRLAEQPADYGSGYGDDQPPSHDDADEDKDGESSADESPSKGHDDKGKGPARRDDDDDADDGGDNPPPAADPDDGGDSPPPAAQDDSSTMDDDSPTPGPSSSRKRDGERHSKMIPGKQDGGKTAKSIPGELSWALLDELKSEKLSFSGREDGGRAAHLCAALQDGENSAQLWNALADLGYFRSQKLVVGMCFTAQQGQPEQGPQEDTAQNESSLALRPRVPPGLQTTPVTGGGPSPIPRPPTPPRGSQSSTPAITGSLFRHENVCASEDSEDSRISQEQLRQAARVINELPPEARQFLLSMVEQGGERSPQFPSQCDGEGSPADEEHGEETNPQFPSQCDDEAHYADDEMERRSNESQDSQESSQPREDDSEGPGAADSFYNSFPIRFVVAILDGILFRWFFRWMLRPVQEDRQPEGFELAREHQSATAAPINFPTPLFTSAPPSGSAPPGCSEDIELGTLTPGGQGTGQEGAGGAGQPGDQTGDQPDNPPKYQAVQQHGTNWWKIFYWTGGSLLVIGLMLMCILLPLYFLTDLL